MQRNGSRYRPPSSWYRPILPLAGLVVLAAVSLVVLQGEQAPVVELVLEIGVQAYPADPAPSPDGSLIAYQYRRGLWLWDERARTATSLFMPPQGHHVRHPAWSPDGSRLAFQYVGDHGVGIWSIGVDGWGLTPLTSPPVGAMDSSPAWSPDGQTLAFVETVLYPADRAIWLLDLAGGEPRRLAPGAEPAWALDGRSLAVSRTPAAGGPREIWLITLAGEELRLGTGFSPAWSPDGTLAYLDIRTDERVLARRPDGSPLARVQEETQELWILRQDKPVQLTRAPVAAAVDEKQWAADVVASGDPTPRVLVLSGRYADWSPDWEGARSIVFLREDDLTGYQAIYRLRWGR